MFEFYFSITLFKYGVCLNWDKFNGRLENDKYIPIKKPYVFKTKETERVAAKYYGGWWSWSWNWLYLEFEISKLV